MPGGRPSKYDWDDKRDICYELYVEQKKSPRDIVKYFANHFGVPESEIPSVRLFRRQFNEKWKFPPRKERLKPDEEAVVVERIKQLWEQNLSVKAIREALEEEGWELGDNEFQRLRKTNGYRRRGEWGSYATTTVGAKRKRGAPPDGPSVASAGLDDDEGAAGEMGGFDAGTADALLALQQQPPGLSPAEQARRAQRLAEVQAASDAAMLTRKRRRRIRGYGHLPPDDPGLEPRYSSETTLDECKAFLHLSNEMYTTIRAEYEAICLDMGIERKKTVSENGTWQASKDRLVRENEHLRTVMHPLQPNLEKKEVAIDVLCADVTKRMRDSKKKMTLADANNLLGLNPTASKELRRVFYDILERDQYTTRLACGDEHWAELREQWFASSPVLQHAIAEATVHPAKMRAVDVICRDATKRFNDDKIRQDPTRKQYKQTVYGPGPGSCKANRKKGPASSATSAAVTTAHGQTLATNAAVAAAAANQFGGGGGSSNGDALLDPALVTAAPAAIPVYFRLAPQSPLAGHHPPMWLGTLSTRSIDALHAAAASCTEGGAAQVRAVHGIIANNDGTEDSYQMSGDDELDMYLRAAGDKATFVALLERGYA